MGRKERRIQKKLEKNPIRELNKIQNRYYSQLFWKFAQTKDPRHPSYGKEITIKSDPITLEFEVLSIGGNGIYHATEYSEYDLKKISYEERGFCLVSYPFIDKFAIQVLDELAKQYD